MLTQLHHPLKIELSEDLCMTHCIDVKKSIVRNAWSFILFLLFDICTCLFMLKSMGYCFMNVYYILTFLIPCSFSEKIVWLPGSFWQFMFKPVSENTLQLKPKQGFK